MGRIKQFDRIRTNKEFNTVYKRADKVWHTPYFVLFYKKSTERKVGFVASKKVGKAVQRNRAKRLLRALFISKTDDLRLGSYILVAKPPILEASYSDLLSRFADTMKKSKTLL